MKTKTIFISGPMTGIEGFNFPAFHAAAQKLRAEGYAVVSPATLFGGDTDIDYETMMRVDMAAMLACDELYLLDGFLLSPGSRREKDAAIAAGMNVRASDFERAEDAANAQVASGKREFTKADAEEFADAITSVADQIVGSIRPCLDDEDVPPGYVKIGKFKPLDEAMLDPMDYLRHKVRQVNAEEEKQRRAHDRKKRRGKKR